MKKIVFFHYSVGLLFFIIFLLTGGYMLFKFPDLYVGREEVRMMFRATHIYILMSVLVNCMTGNYLLRSDDTSFVGFRTLASLLVLIVPFIFLWAFIVEPPNYQIDRPISYWGVISLFLGVLIHSVINGYCVYRDKRASND